MTSIANCPELMAIVSTKLLSTGKLRPSDFSFRWVLEESEGERKRGGRERREGRKREEGRDEGREGSRV